ncbi:hypothetical protein CEXT_790991 [Caerostris extrusa]|uniref:Uncharacterized protein n=1 Tax=Caerostris extrusa TaxID=172846 RepID=A0AAV4V1Y5_CAEEX|nr:hypothetical protein CEXT_790991 [Caerostris extrusa]
MSCGWILTPTSLTLWPPTFKCLPSPHLFTRAHISVGLSNMPSTLKDMGGNCNTLRPASTNFNPSLSTLLPTPLSTSGLVVKISTFEFNNDNR